MVFQKTLILKDSSSFPRSAWSMSFVCVQETLYNSVLMKTCAFMSLKYSHHTLDEAFNDPTTPGCSTPWNDWTKYALQS